MSGLRGNALYQTLDFSSMGNNLRWFCVLAAIAIMTAAMSVFMVLRSIFMERQNHLRVLKKIGVSNKRLGTMLMIECVSFAIVQTIAGTALGILVYFGIFRFEVSVLGKSPYSAFDGNDFIQTYTPNPFLWAVIASFLVIVIAYILVITLSKKNIALRSKSRNSERSFNGLFTILFRQNFITAIQLLALTMICTGTLLGYTYFSNEGKEGDPNISIDVAKSYIPVSFIVSDNVDMEKEKIHEYYYCPPPSIASVNSFSMVSENYDFGIDDSIAGQLGNVMAVGDITWTISVCEQGAAIDNTNVIDDETMSFLGLPDELKDKAIAPMCGKIINQPVFERVASEITNGEVDISSLDSGTQVIILSYSENSDYAVGDKIAIGSISTKNGYTASNYHEKETEVAAILSITDISDTLVKSILDTESEIIFLTTQKGAQNLGIAQAAYTEIFSESEVNGVMIPSSFGFQKVSYDELKKEQIIDKMTEYGGMTLLIVLMSALGFFAYFNGIGMKIRLKSYQLSLLCAVGCNKKTIKNRILVNNLKLPVAAAFLTTIIIKCVQITTEKAYRYALSLVQPSADGAISFDSSILNEVDKINYDYFLDNRLWAVPILKPLLIVLSVMCIITFLLTLFALRNFKGNIADTLNKERVRK